MAITSSFYHRYYTWHLHWQASKLRNKWLLSPPENGLLPCDPPAIGKKVKSDYFSYFMVHLTILYGWLAVWLPAHIWSHAHAIVLFSLSHPLPHWSFSSVFVLHCPLSLSHTPFALLRRWLYGKTVCSIYAFCGMLFGICSLTTLTLLSMVCFVKVCYPLYGKSSKKLFLPNEMTHGLTVTSLSGWLLIYLWKETKW